jgi:hypothetical protein
VGEDKEKKAPAPDIEAHRKHGREVTDEPDESRLEKKEDDSDVEAHRKFGRE